MKIRVGYGFGVRTPLNDGRFGEVVDALEDLRWDSLWLSERIGGDAPDPLVAMSFAAGRTRKLKFGMSVMVLPGRNPIVLAKELATLDRMSNGRLLPAFGLGVADPQEQQAFGVAREDRAKIFDEALAVLRKCWRDDVVDHDGRFFRYSGLRVQPKPLQQHIDVWLGGIAPSELKRVGRLSDGWLPSFILPDEAGAGRETVEAVAAEHGRTMDPEHYGALIAYSMGPVPDAILAGLAKRRPDVDPRAFVPVGLDAVAERIRAFTEVGFSKFVVVPLVEPTGFTDHLAEAAAALLPLQT